MKRFFLFIFLLIININVVNASCKPEALKEVYYCQYNYKVGYCYNQSFGGAGCMPTSYSMLIANLYDSSFTPLNMRNYICENQSIRNVIKGSGGDGMGSASSMFGYSDFASRYTLTFTRIVSAGGSIDINEVKEILKGEDMIIASIKCNSGSECAFTKNMHYIVLSNVTEDGKIVILNPSTSYGTNCPGPQAYTDDVIMKNITNGHINQGMWRVSSTNTNCSNVKSNGSRSSGGVSNNVTVPNEGEVNDTVPDFKVVTSDKLLECNSLFGNEDDPNPLGKFVQDLFNFIKIMTPVLVIVLSSIEYIKALTNNDASDMKKVNARILKRIVIGIIIFLLPFLLDLLFHLFGLYNLSSCGIK